MEKLKQLTIEQIKHELENITIDSDLCFYLIREGISNESILDDFPELKPICKVISPSFDILKDEMRRHQNIHNYENTLYNEFYRYWMMPINKGRNKNLPRWKDEKTWRTNSRLATFIANREKDGKPYKKRKKETVEIT